MPKKVLVVDDDPFILAVVEKFLKIKGFLVVTTTDPELAYRMAEKEKPDLLISDVAMPGVDGFTLLRHLRDDPVTKTIPLVLLTATDKIADVEKGFESGAKAYLLKPIDWDRAWPKIEAIIGKP